MTDAIGSALLGGASSLFSSIGNMFSSNNSLKAQREANAMNYKIWQEQKQHNYDIYDYQFNKEAEYNDPTAVRNRLEAAGYNPYLMYGDVSSAPSAGIQASTPPAIQPPQPGSFYNPLQGIGEAVSSAMNTYSAYSQIQKNNAETKKTLEDTVTSFLTNKGLKFDYDFIKPLSRQILGQQLQDMKLTNQFNADTFSARKEAIRLENDYRASQVTMSLLQNSNMRIVNRYLDKEKQLNIAQQAQLLHNLKVSGVKTEKEIQQILAQTVKTQLEAQGQRISNYTASSIADDYISATNESNRYLRDKSRDDRLQFLSLDPVERFDAYDSSHRKDYYDLQLRGKDFKLREKKISHDMQMDKWRLAKDYLGVLMNF